MRRRARGQSGFTLMEAAIATVVVAVVILGLAAAMQTASTSTRDNVGTGKLQLAVTSFGEAIKSVPFTPCADATRDFNDKFGSDPTYTWTPPMEGLATVHATVNRVEYASNTPGGDVTGFGDLSTCDPAAVDPGRQNSVQLITFTIRWDGPRGNETLMAKVVKRNPKACPTLDQASCSDG